MESGQELEEPCKRHLGEAGHARLTHFFVYFFGPITHVARGLPCCTEDVCNPSDCPTYFVCTPCTSGQIQASYKLSAASGFGTPCAWRQTATKHGQSKNFRGGIFFFPKAVADIIIIIFIIVIMVIVVWEQTPRCGHHLGFTVLCGLGQLLAWVGTVLSVPRSGTQLQPGCAPLAWGLRDRTQQCPCGDGALHRHWASPYLVAEKPATAPCWQLVLASGITFTEKIEGKAIAKYIVPVTVTEMTLGLARLQSSCYGAPPVLQLMLLLL